MTTKEPYRVSVGALDLTRQELIAGMPQRERTRISEIARKKWETVMLQREEILAAFIAKYGCDPDEVTQVQERDMETFLERWYVRRKTAEEMFRDAGTGHHYDHP